MDAYHNYVTKKLSLRIDSNEKTRSLLKKTVPIKKVVISYDQFYRCIGMIVPQNYQYHLDFYIYDEDILRFKNDYKLRYDFLNFLNQFPSATYSFNLSDSTFPLYIELMSMIDWKHENTTSFEMTLDRNPVSSKNIPLGKAKGKVNITEEKLLWFPDEILNCIPSNIVDKSRIEEAKRLRQFSNDFGNKLDYYYNTVFLNEFDKAFIAYHYLFDKNKMYELAIEPIGIKYAYSRIYRDKNNKYRLKAQPGWESEPYGTLIHREGVCAGQARLFNSLICSPAIGIPADEIIGNVQTGERHAWSNFIIDEQIYQCCTTSKGIFSNLDEAGYTPDPDQVYDGLYPHVSLNETEKNKIKNRVYLLER